MQLAGQNVVVVGGASGIGLGIAEACVAAGATVTVVGRSAEKLTAAAARASVRALRADATDEAAVERLFAATGPVHQLVVTAVDAVYQPVRKLDISRARCAFDSKVIAALLLSKHAPFAANASLILTSGIAMDRPGPSASVIAAMNGAVTAMTRALAIELAPVRVNVLSPGWIDTPVWDTIAGSAKSERLAQHAAKLPVRRIGTPSDVASAALYLMTNGFTTGETLHVDGGHRLV